MSLNEDMHELRLSPCPDCKHFDFKRAEQTGEWVCSAFPEGIPEEIVQGRSRHPSALPDQVGEYVFDPIEDDEE